MSLCFDTTESFGVGDADLSEVRVGSVGPLQPWESAHRVSGDALDLTHLRRGAEQVSVDIGRERRVALNQVARATGICLAEQVRQALDAWLVAHRSNEGERS